MKKLIVMAIPVVAIGVVAALGFSGVIPIPGLSHKKALKNALATYAEAKDLAPPVPKVAANDTPTTTAPTKPMKQPDTPLRTDPEQGAESLAGVWNEIKVPQLLRIAADWKDEELAKVFVKMDTDKVAKVIEEMAKGSPESGVKANPGRASKLSKILRDQGSIVKADGDAVNG